MARVRQGENDPPTGCSLGCLAMIVVPMLIVSCVAHQHRATVTETVIGKERIHTKHGGYYLVYCEAETFRISDSAIEMRWDSSDVYGHIKEGQTYRFEVYGWRVPFLSWYRNIVTAEMVESGSDSYVEAGSEATNAGPDATGQKTTR